MKKQTVRLAGEAALLLMAGGALVYFGLLRPLASEVPEAPGQQADSLATTGMRKMQPAPPRPLGDDERSVAERLDAAALAAEVKLVLAEDDRLERFTFDPEARDGYVTLWGKVETAEQRRQAVAVARAVEGVRSVANEITVQGAPDVAETATPGQAEPDSPEVAAYHVVQPGETLWVIARENDMTVERLEQLNDLGSSRLHPGDKLRVR